MITIFNKDRCAWLGFFTLACVYIFSVANHSLNVPYSDDFHQQLYTAISLEQGADVTDSVFRQHNVHRLLTTHVFTYLEHAITGKVDLDNQLLIAFVFLVALAIVIGSYSRAEHRPIVMLIIGMVVLTPEHGSVWVGGTTQYYALILFSLLSLKWLYHIDRPTYLLGSILCMFLAVYSMIGGVLLPIFGLVYLILSKRITRPSSLIWLVASALSLLWYFNNYSSHSKQPSIFFFLEEPMFTVEFTFRMLGNFLSDLVEHTLLAYLSFFALLSFIYVLAAKRSLKEFFSNSGGVAFLYILILIGSVIAGRAGFEQPLAAYADRYFIYTKTLWVLALIILLNKQLLSKQALAFVLGLSTLYMLATYQGEMRNLKALQQSQSDAMIDFLVRGNPAGFEFNNNQREAGRLVRKAVNLGIYTPGLLPTPSRKLKYLKYSDFVDGLGATVIRDQDVGDYRYFAFSINNQSSVHEVAIVPRGVSGPAFLLKAAALIQPSRLKEAGSKAAKGGDRVYEVVIDRSNYDNSSAYDVFVISLGMITTIGSF